MLTINDVWQVGSIIWTGKILQLTFQVDLPHITSEDVASITGWKAHVAPDFVIVIKRKKKRTKQHEQKV